MGDLPWAIVLLSSTLSSVCFRVLYMKTGRGSSVESYVVRTCLGLDGIGT